MKRSIICSFVFWGSNNSVADAFSVKPALTVRGLASISQPCRPLLDSSMEPSTDDKEQVPSMDWLTNSLNNPQEKESEMEMLSSPFMEEHSVDNGDLGDVAIPATGVSVADEIGRSTKDRFFTEVVRIKGLPKGVNAAQIVTSASTGSFESVRYLVGLSKSTDNSEATNDFAMVDIPPYSDQLKVALEKFMGKNGRLTCMLITTRDNIHYDEAPGVVYAIPRSDLMKWEKAFPEAIRVAYRLDIPRDCRDSITQRLDGYGPFALDESTPTNLTFVETGRPLTYVEPADGGMTDMAMEDEHTTVHDDNVEDMAGESDDALYTPEAIREREEGKRILAIYTPGRSYGSVTYVFPEAGLCASGFTIPVEDNRSDENTGLDSPGPALDCRGYITTSRAGIQRQTESARSLINNYVDRFSVVLASRNDPLFLDGDDHTRRTELLEIIAQYEKIGQIYEQLGITNSDNDEPI